MSPGADGGHIGGAATKERSSNDTAQSHERPSAVSHAAPTGMRSIVRKWEPPPWFLREPSADLRGLAEEIGRAVGAGNLSIGVGEALIHDAIAHMPGAPLQFPPYGPWRDSRFRFSLIRAVRDTAREFERELAAQGIAVRKAVGPVLINRGRREEILAVAAAAGPDLSLAEIERIATEESAWWLRTRGAAE